MDNIRTKISRLLLMSLFLMMLLFIPTITKAQSTTASTTKPVSILDPLSKLQIKIPGLEKLASSSPAACTTAGDKTSCSLPWIAIYIKAIYNYAIGIVGILAALALMIGGVIYLTSLGNATRISEAKSWITGALTGMLIMFTSYILLNEVNPDLVGLKPIELSIVKEEPAEDYENSPLSGNSPSSASFCQSSCSYRGGDCQAKLEKGTYTMNYCKGWWKSKFSKPAAGNFVSCFGFRAFRPKEAPKTEWHPGVDISCVKNTPTYAMKDGIVVVAEQSKGTGFGGYGRCLVIYHGGGIFTLYGHNEKILVKPGDHVKTGDKVTLSGDTDAPGAFHLHFEVRKSPQNLPLTASISSLRNAAINATRSNPCEFEGYVLFQ